MVYTAFIADIVNSKKLHKENREQIQIFLKASLHTLNQIFKPSLEFDVIFSAGDEVQGLFRSPAAAYLYFRLFRMVLAPLQIRCGLGIGEWEVRIPSGTSAEQDGSAYHRARAAIANAHDRNGYSVIFNSHNENDLFLNTLANTALLFSKKQSPYQNQVLLLSELIQPFFNQQAMDLNAFTQLPKLILNKGTLTALNNPKNKADHSKNKSEIDPEQFNQLPAFWEPLIISPVAMEGDLTLVLTFKKGLSTKLANLTNTSRQNIDNVLKTANITEIRRIEATTLLMLHKTWEVQG